MKNSAVVAAIALISLLLVGCKEDSGPAWVYGGTHVAYVSDISLPDTIMSSDTLVIRLSATLFQPAGRPEFSHVETNRSERSLEAAVWASVDLWTGSGPMPPTDLTVLEAYRHLEPPPFAVGLLEVVLIQPEGAPIADTVHVAAG